MRSVSHLVKQGLKNPSEVPQFLQNQSIEYIDKYHMYYYRKFNRISRQKPRLERFAQHDGFCIIILDACRYDFFQQWYSEYLEGELSKLWSSGRWTGDYIRHAWDGYNDLTYINSAPVVSDYYFKKHGWSGSPEMLFREIVHLWRTHWDTELGTVHPQAVTDEALRIISESEQPRLVAHYLQPHLPYIGECQLNILNVRKNLEHRLENNLMSPTQEYVAAIESGELSKKELENAYISNLKAVFKEVCRLISKLDCPVVVTSDHGENLGENGNYFHERHTPQTRTVPWLIVDEVTIPLQETNDQSLTKTDQKPIDRSKVESRLHSLGYLE